MADLLDHNRLRKLHERATRTGSGHDRETFTRAALEVVPGLLDERERYRAALAKARELNDEMATALDIFEVTDLGRSLDDVITAAIGPAS